MVLFLVARYQENVQGFANAARGQEEILQSGAGSRRPRTAREEVWKRLHSHQDEATLCRYKH